MKEQIESIKKEIETLNVEMANLRKKHEAELQKKLHEGMKVLFNEYPEVDNVSFTAYTPYFNDGDECTYSCHVDYCAFNGAGDDGTSACEAFDIEPGIDIQANAQKTIYQRNDSGQWKNVPNPNYNPRHEKCVEDFREILGSISDEVWKGVVGDHCIVLIDRDGFKVEECSHD